MQLRPAAEVAQRVPELRLDDGVDDDRPAPLRAIDDESEVVDRLDPRVAHLLERLVRELGLQRGHEPRRGFAGRVRDDVQLYRFVGHLILRSGRWGTLRVCAFWSWTTSAPCGRRSSGR